MPQGQKEAQRRKSEKGPHIPRTQKEENPIRGRCIPATTIVWVTLTWWFGLVVWGLDSLVLEGAWGTSPPPNRQLEGSRIVSNPSQLFFWFPWFSVLVPYSPISLFRNQVCWEFCNFLKRQIPESEGCNMGTWGRPNPHPCITLHRKMATYTCMCFSFSIFMDVCGMFSLQMWSLWSLWTLMVCFVMFMELFPAWEKLHMVKTGRPIWTVARNFHREPPKWLMDMNPPNGDVHHFGSIKIHSLPRTNCRKLLPPISLCKWNPSLPFRFVRELPWNRLRECRHIDHPTFTPI